LGCRLSVSRLGRIGTAHASVGARFWLRCSTIRTCRTALRLALGIARAPSLKISCQTDTIGSRAMTLKPESMLGHAESRCRARAVVVNTARGPIIDLDARYFLPTIRCCSRPLMSCR
jgi:lactate dehydrogenase-like 2-hydroxyacid dehydrogenase